ncbi:MAG: thioredoxin family protein [Candidatus Woesebacteria bacterium]|nr:thioredoxin family protein [Candidatus Woesebacteria bacterium]
MKIQVLGSGCPTCKKLNDITIQAVKELGLTDKVEYLTGEAGTSKIIELGIMSSPVLVVNDTPVMVGFTPDIEKVKSLIQKAK